MKINMNGIYKNFGKKEVLKDVSLTMGNGVYGLDRKSTRLNSSH